MEICPNDKRYPTSINFPRRALYNVKRKARLRERLIHPPEKRETVSWPDLLLQQKYRISYGISSPRGRRLPLSAACSPRAPNPYLSLLEIIHNTGTHAAQLFINRYRPGKRKRLTECSDVSRVSCARRVASRRARGPDILFTAVTEIFMLNEAHCGPPSDFKAIVSATDLITVEENAPILAHFMQIFRRVRDKLVLSRA